MAAAGGQMGKKGYFCSMIKKRTSRRYMLVCCVLAPLAAIVLALSGAPSSVEGADRAVPAAAAVSAKPRQFPTDYFAPPLHRPMAFSGLYGEVRLNHFHAGIDLRVGGQVGDPVYAAADGYVSRIHIMEGGGGKMLALTHPNGYRTYYMHLNGYAGRIAQTVRAQQHAEERYAIDTLPPPDALPVKKGELIAYVGNTGGSAGPHLHFEIRDGEGAVCYNPLLFGFDYNDPVAPTIRGIRIYPVQPTGTVDGKSGAQELKGTTARVAGPFYLGIYATDASEGSTLRNGIRRIEVTVDGKPYFRFQLDTLYSGHGNVVNALIDYSHMRVHKQPYILTRRLKGMHDDPTTAATPGDGILRLPNGTHHISVSVSDCKHNQTRRSFDVQTTTLPPSPVAAPRWGSRKAAAYNRSWTLKAEGCDISMEANTLYDDDTLCFSIEHDNAYCSPVYRIEPTWHRLPPRKSYRVAIAKAGCTTTDSRHLTLALRDIYNTLIYIPVRDSGDYYVAQVYGFGRMALSHDSEPPTAKPVNFTNGGTVHSRTLRVKIKDDRMGVEEYKCHVNGHWVLAEYDRKSATLIIDTEGWLTKGANVVELDLTDGCRNSAHYRYQLTYSDQPPAKKQTKNNGKKRRRR